MNLETRSCLILEHVQYLNLNFPIVFCKVLELVNRGEVKGLAHITGGGFTDNIPRIFPEGLGACIKANSWGIPPIFKWIQEVRQSKCYYYYVYLVCLFCRNTKLCPKHQNILIICWVFNWITLHVLAECGTLHYIVQKGLWIFWWCSIFALVKTGKHPK